ncbi:MAG: hypothetical protein SF029_11845 [bacterium]|nr:hypothetical protein [bacterium]
MAQEAVDLGKVSNVDIPLTPRERRLERVGDVLRWGAILNAIFTLLVLVITVIAAAGENSELARTLSDVLMLRSGGLREDAVLLAVVLLTLGNISALLVAMVGVLAQEIWALALLAAIVIANVIGLVLLGFLPGLISIGFAVLSGVILFADLRAFRTNPVMLKEVRERMRGARAFVVITVYLGLMSGFTVLLYLIRRGLVDTSGSAVTGELGRVLFAGVVGLELLLIIFIAPAFTAGAVTSERERKTFDLLQITLLPRPSFIIGKLESALTYIFLLLLAAIPLQSIAFLFGGVSETELVLAFLILAVTAITLGTVGLFFSTLVDRTLTASVRAYTVAFAVTVGLPIVLGWFIGFFQSALTGTGTNITNSPVIEAALIYFGAFLVSMNPILTALATRELLVNRQEIGFWTATLSSDGSQIPLASPWISFTILYLVVSTILVVLAVRRMRRAEV